MYTDKMFIDYCIERCDELAERRGQLIKRAKYVRDVNPHHNGDQKLWRVDPPMKYDVYDYNFERLTRTTEYIVTSAVVALSSGPETYIFPADRAGNIIAWDELRGSFRGELSHHKALNYAGYLAVGLPIDEEYSQ